MYQLRIPFYSYIGTISAKGITAGCGSNTYCPDSHITREQMAIFIERAMGVFTPVLPRVLPHFSDINLNAYSYPFIEDFYYRGITGGLWNKPIEILSDRKCDAGANGNIY